ncbi:MAG: hypothetical protein R3E39_22005 [Anaerolineae bacterium]
MAVRRRYTLLVLLILFSVLFLSNPISTFAQGTNPPILVVVNSAATNKFGRYLGEILKAEGVSSFDIVELSSVTLTSMQSRSLVILAETTLSGAQATMFSSYVSGGGNLIAMRPTSQLASLFGLGTLATTGNNGYLQINSGASINGYAPGSGLVTQTLQIHGVTDLWNLSGGVSLAQYYSNATTSTVYPAVVSNATGSAIAFTYDLPTNVILTRQGNPGNANLDTDGDNVLRTIDLFQTSGGGAPWIDRK